MIFFISKSLASKIHSRQVESFGGADGVRDHALLESALGAAQQTWHYTQDIYETDKLILELFPENKELARWIKMAQDRIAFQGLPARICWLGQGEREKAGLAFNKLVADGKVKAPLVTSAPYPIQVL